MALVALLLYVEDTEGSGLAVGLLALAITLPSLLAGLLAGTVVDRSEQRTLMIACDVGRALVYGAIAGFLPRFPLLLALVALGSALDAVFSPAGRSSVPALVAPEDLRAANAWLGTALNMQVVFGPLAGGVVADALGVRAALAGNALTFLASATLLTRLPPLRYRRAEDAEPATFVEAVRAGFFYVASHAAARAVVASLFLAVTFAAVDNVAVVFLARDVFEASPVGFGVLASAFGIGMLVASVTLTSARLRAAAGGLFLVGMLMSGAGTLLTGLAPTLAVAVGVYALAGAGNAIQNVGSDTLVQESVAPHMLGRVFSLVRTGAVAGSSLAAVGAGVLLDLTSPRAVLVIGGCGVLAVLVLAWFLLPAPARRLARKTI